MRRTSYKLTRLAAVAALAIASFSTYADEKPVELKFAHWMPAIHPLAKLGFEPWAKSVEAASNGSIRVVLFPAQQLGKAADHYDLTRDGLAQMSWVSPGYQAGRFPVFAAGDLPFILGEPGPSSAALDQWYRQYAEAEMKDVKYCFAHIHSGTFHSRKPISEPDQLRGMKIRSANGAVARIMNLLGATNVQVSAPESRDALQKGLADAITFPWGSLISFGIDKAVTYHTDMRLYSGAFVWVLNREWYDALSEKQKQVINDHCNNEWAEKIGAAWGDEEDSGRTKLMNSPRHTLVEVSPAQMEAWREAVKPVYAEWIQSVDAIGVDGQKALDALKKELSDRGVKE